MGSLVVVTEWSSNYGEWVPRARGPVKAHALVISMFAELDRDFKMRRTPERLSAAIDLLRAGGPGPSTNSPEWVDGGQEGVQLSQANGVSMLEDPLFPQRGELVLESSALVDFFEVIRERERADAHKDRERGPFSDIEVPILAAGPGAWKTYLRRGGRLSRVEFSDDRERFAYIAAEVDGEWMWVDEGSGEPVLPVGWMPGPAEEPEPGTESDLERVVRLLGDIAVDSWDAYTRVADPSGALHDVAPLFERLTAADRDEVPGFFSETERRSLTSGVNSLCGRALTEDRSSYLSAAAMCLEIGLNDNPGGDGFAGMAVLHHTAVRLGVEVGVANGPGAPISYPRFAERYHGFLERTDEAMRRPERFGWIETQQGGAIRFTQYRPETSLGKRRED